MRRWTEEDLEILRTRGAYAAAELLGRSEGACVWREYAEARPKARSRTRVPSRPPPRKEAWLLGPGLHATAEQAAERLGVSRDQLMRWRVLLGLSGARRRAVDWSPEEDEIVRQTADQDAQEVSRRLRRECGTSRTVAAVRGRRQRLRREEARAQARS